MERHADAQDVWEVVGDAAAARHLPPGMRQELRRWAGERMRSVPGSVWEDDGKRIVLRDSFVKAVAASATILSTGGSLT